jgi:hypothetical protein
MRRRQVSNANQVFSNPPNLKPQTCRPGRVQRREWAAIYYCSPFDTRPLCSYLAGVALSSFLFFRRPKFYRHPYLSSRCGSCNPADMISPQCPRFGECRAAFGRRRPRRASRRSSRMSRRPSEHSDGDRSTRNAAYSTRNPSFKAMWRSSGCRTALQARRRGPECVRGVHRYIPLVQRALARRAQRLQLEHNRSGARRERARGLEIGRPESHARHPTE